MMLPYKHMAIKKRIMNRVRVAHRARLPLDLEVEQGSSVTMRMIKISNVGSCKERMVKELEEEEWIGQ